VGISEFPNAGIRRGFEGILRNHDVAQSRLGESCSLMEVSRITGIEPSRIRFMEREFPDLFGEKERSPLRSDHFDHRQVELLICEIVRISVLYDLVILDTSAGIATNVMTFLNVSDETILVVTPTVASTLDAYGVMKSMNDSKMGGHHHIVVNRAVDADSAVEVASRLQACAGM